MEYIKNVVDSGLCTRCGGCVGLADGKISFSDRLGKYLPEINGEIDAPLRERIKTSCSGADVDFPAIDQFVNQGKGEHHDYLGTYRGLYIGFSEEPAIRRHGGSAGVISTTLIWLLENKTIDGAVVLGMSKEEPWMNRPFIATTAAEVLDAAQSKYTISSNNEILPEIEKFNGILAFVGLPCQVHSIRKLQKANDPSVKNIKYIIAPFCGLNLHFSSVISFLKANGEKNYKDLKSLSFRHGEWPGNMRAEMKNGRVISLPKFHANYLIPFHMMKRCMHCIDATNEFSDISVGDAWAPVYEERGKGFSFVISRTEAGKEILDRMEAEKVVNLQTIDLDHAVKMHSHMYDNKKRGAYIRMKRAKHKPDYYLPYPENIPFKRRMFETSLNTVFVILRTKPVIKLFEILPQKLVGTVFDNFKVFWKKMTYKVKRESL